MIVIDASALVEWLLGLEGAAAVEARLKPGEPLSAPHALDVEVAPVVRRYAHVGEIDHERGRLA